MYRPELYQPVGSVNDRQTNERSSLNSDCHSSASQCDSCTQDLLLGVAEKIPCTEIQLSALHFEIIRFLLSSIRFAFEVETMWIRIRLFHV